nr:FCD domain-containing protein [Microbacterium ulmi]
MGNVSRLAVGRCSDDELAQILENLDAVIEASARDDKLAILDASAVLFAHLTHVADNAAFLRVMREGELAIRRSLAGWRPAIESPVGRTEAYRVFRAAIAARDADGVERSLRALHGLE